MAAVAFFIDEDVHEGLAAALRRKGIDAVNAHECGRKEAKDAEQLAFAVSQQRALMTFNLADFEALAETYFWQGKQHFGIIVSPQRSLRETLRRLVSLTEKFTHEALLNQFMYL
jgi:predicted nuclease of predicted toxin-antitoxin system